MGSSAVTVRNSVVDVAGNGRLVTAWGTAGQIAAADKVRELTRGHIPGLGRRVGGMHQRAQPCLTGQLREHLRGDQLLLFHHVCHRVRAAIDGGLLGDDVDRDIHG